MARTKKTEVTVEETISESTPAIEVKKETKPIKPDEIPMNQTIPVKSNVPGGLTYVSPKTNATYRWSESGDVEYIEYSELIVMRNSHKKFFEKNWIVFEDSDYTAEEVYKALNVNKFYDFGVSDINKIFTLSVDEIAKIYSKATSGLKESIRDRAKMLYQQEDEAFDSNRKTREIGEILGITFERI